MDPKDHQNENMVWPCIFPEVNPRVYSVESAVDIEAPFTLTLQKKHNYSTEFKKFPRTQRN